MPNCLMVIGRLLGFMLLLLSLVPPVIAGEGNGTAQGPSPEKIAALIQTLEDPQARQELIAQLEILALAQAPPEKPRVKSAASQLLLGISSRLDVISKTFLSAAGAINELPLAWQWLRQQGTEPQLRSFWGEVLLNLTLVLLAAYGTALLLRALVRRPRRTLQDRDVASAMGRAGRLVLLLLLELIPVAGFLAAAWLSLAIIDPREKTRLVALAWVNAFILAQVVIALAELITASESPRLRIPRLADETAHYLKIWAGRLSRTVLYGYFFLQAALLLDLSRSLYELLLGALGLVVAILLFVVVLQNRIEVRDWLQRVSEESRAEGWSPRALLGRLGKIWHLLAGAYVIALYLIWSLKVPGGAWYLLRASLLSVVALLAGAGLLRLFEIYMSRGFRISDDQKSRFPGLESRANRYLGGAHVLLKAVVYLFVALAVLQAWGVNVLEWLASEPGKVLGGTAVRVVGIIVISLVVWEVANSLIQRYLNILGEDGVTPAHDARSRTLMTIARKALLVVLMVISSLMVLAELGVNIGPLLAGAGVLGLAVGFGSQKLVQDVITGVFILLEDQVAVGDVIKVGDKGGVVEAVSIRTVRLRDVAGTVHTIPYSTIDNVSNLTKDFSYYVMEVGVAYREDMDEVMKVLREIGAALQEDEEYGPKILEPLEVLGVDAFADSAVVIKARLKTIPIKQWWVGREFNRRMKKRFDELGIEIPFPHTTIYFGESKGGGAPPAFLNLQQETPVSPPAVE
ncbi:mechanosensitive ion channel domain-containing protein [uncultured Desulfuromonas sp.]|uniref:mechanosensitive ion channel domain-containing protein n=1 Tax=uncultured Desulfuromonas sp. TaxID=181013 RepID=UPI00261160C8|nr:mechanosensitive ion channel domain-containing protein [uncultured Desulfuromonas sp.]